MQAAIKLTARVQPDHRIEICAPELPVGQEVELIVLLQETPAPKRRSVLEIVAGLPPGPRLFQTPEEADRYLQEERGAWDR